MSDFYDSLEDEGNDDKSSCGSSRSFETNFSTTSLKNCGSEPTVARKSFHLNKKYNTSKNRSLSGARRTKASHNVLGGLHLPSIANENTKNGAELISFDIDDESLSKRGLQLNKDGSFTKSPRLELESLPFVAREYRNLQFQKKKTYEMRNRAPSKIFKKTVFTFSANPKESISMTKLIGARRKKGSSEELLFSRGSLSSSRDDSKENKDLESDNLTDSMKEVLLKKQTQKIHSLHNFKAFEHTKKVKRVTNSVEKYQKTSERACTSLERPDMTSCRSDSGRLASVPQNVLTQSRSRTVHSLFGGQTKVNHRTTSGGKQTNPNVTTGFFRGTLFGKSLSYSERRQIANGFNPLCLRPGSKKVTSETNRSNFGDSVAERLSEVSSRVLGSAENIDDEEEEMFYWDLIEKDRAQKMRKGHSTKSEAFLQISAKNSLSNSKFWKGQQLNQVNIPSLKVNRNSKSTSIVLPAEARILNKENKTKQSHYCFTESSTLSKAELANKARAYGYLVNARNIFKMKNSSKGLSTVDKKNNRTVVGNTEGSCPTTVKDKKEPDEAWGPQESTSREVSQDRSSLFRASGAQSQEEKLKKHAAFVLPLVEALRRDDNNFTSEILKEISSCLSHSAHWSLST